MCANPAIKRVKLKIRRKPNPLFEKWLTEWRDEAKNNGSDRHHCFSKAIRSLQKYPFPLKSGKECIILENFGKKICEMLDKKLEKYEENVGLDLENSFETALNIAKKGRKRKSTSPKASEKLCSNVRKKKKSLSPSKCQAQQTTCIRTESGSSHEMNKNTPGSSESRKEYIPSAGSGPYALLLTLFQETIVGSKESMSKKELQEKAQELCTSSFTTPLPGSHYTAWSCMRTLLKKGLVSNLGKPAKFKLTEDGIDLAIKLKSLNVVESFQSKTQENITSETQAYQYLTPPPSSQITTSQTSSSEKKTSYTVTTNYLTATISSEITKKPTNTACSSNSGILHKLSPSPERTNDSEELKCVVKNQRRKNKECLPVLSDKMNAISDGKAIINDGVARAMTDDQANDEELLSQVEHETVFLLPGSFDVLLLVDTQEKDKKSQRNCEASVRELKSRKVNFEVRHLSVGDFTWICRDRDTGYELILPYIVERKRMDDFGQSIKDGRFHEQKFRLKKCGIENLIYLVEKHGKNEKLGLPVSTILQAASNTQVIDGFTVRFTDSHDGSMRYLSCMTTKLTEIFKNKTLMSCKKDDLKPCDIFDDLQQLMTFKEFNKSSGKQKKFTVREMLIKHLIQLNGLTLDKAVAITDEYPTPQSLFKLMSTPDGEKSLATLKYGTSNRRIGPVIAGCLYKLFSHETLK